VSSARSCTGACRREWLCNVISGPQNCPPDTPCRLSSYVVHTDAGPRAGEPCRHSTDEEEAVEEVATNKISMTSRVMMYTF